MPPFKFYLSKDVPSPFKFKIDRLETIPLSFHEDPPYQVIYITCDLICNGLSLCGTITTTFQDFEQTTIWNQWIKAPIKYKDIPLHTQIHIKIWDTYGPGKKIVIGEASMPLYSDTSRAHEGVFKINLNSPHGASPTPIPSTALAELDRLEQVMKKYKSQKSPRIEWLDSKVMTEFDKIKREAMLGCGGKMFLHIEFTKFEYPVLFNQTPLLRKRQINYTINERGLVTDSQEQQNPVERKYLKLAHRSSIYDKDLKPDQSERMKIDKIVSYPPQKALTIEERAVIWKFRYFIAQNPKALPKFLQCIDWMDPQNVTQGVEMISDWEPMHPTDALELLSKQFTNIDVRKYAVNRLATACDEDLLSYLLQLVQAMGYERTGETPLTNLLISRGSKNFELGNYLHWYLTVESLNSDNRSKCFKKKLRLFHLALSSENDVLFKELKRGEDLVKTLTTIQSKIKNLTWNRPKKIEALKAWLGEKGKFSELYSMDSLPLPLDTDVNIIGVIPEKATIFKSAMQPLGIRFALKEDKNYMILFKAGDDLRQDQFIVQLIALMDKLLKYENLDLQLTPYRVLATSNTEGLLECVTPSQAIASVLKFEGSISKYLRAQENYEKALDTFVRSCAGYCVITYILGIGDRHLDNLLITPKGNLFHIDFGFILGRDPKPFPPPMKLCKEMVEGMGGASSEHYLKFKEHCCEAYNILRKSANLILNLFQLMIDSNIPDICEEPEKSMLKVLEKFRLELSDEEASQFFQSLMNASVSALFPVITEAVHRWGQYWRA